MSELELKKPITLKSGPVTLQHLIDDNRYLHLACLDCGSVREFPVDKFQADPETPVPEVGKFAKCSNCGSKRIHSTGQINVTPLPKSLQFDGRKVL